MSISAGMPHISVQRQQQLESFAEYVSVLPWFNVNVLHKLYINVYKPLDNPMETYHVRAIMCSDILQSPLVRRVSYNAFVMDTLLQDELRRNMEGHEAQLKIAQFMLAYAIDCRKHFLGPKYIESYRIEGNLILNPSGEAERISRHIIDRLNQVKNFDQKKNSVGYYLNVLEKEGPASKHTELIKFLKGFQDYKKESPDIPEAWKTIIDSTIVDRETVTLKIPGHIKNKIINEISDHRQQVAPPTLFALIIGINQYKDDRIVALKGCTADAHMVKDFFKSSQLSQRKYETQVITDAQATRDAIIKSIKDIRKLAKQGDSFLFYFSGYGGLEDSRYITESVASSVQDDTIGATPYLVCHDTTKTNYGLALQELEYLLSLFPNDVMHQVILDCSFQRNTREKPAPGLLIKSLAWTENPRQEFEFLWYDQGKRIVPPFSYNGIVMYASQQNDNAYETVDHGDFTKALLLGIARSNNAISYAELFSGSHSMPFDSTRQSPRFETKGNFDPGQQILEGYLTKTSRPVTSFFIETGQDMRILSEAAEEFISKVPGVFSLTDDQSKAQYIFSWRQEEMWICRNEEILRPLVSISILDSNTIGKSVEYMSHIARWENLRGFDFSGMSEYELDVKLVWVLPDGKEEDVASFDLSNIEFDNSLKPGGIKLQLTNLGQQQIYCAALYLSDRFEINANLLEGKVINLKPGESVWMDNGNVMQFVLDQYVADFNFPFCESYIKILAHTDPFEVGKLEQYPLSAPVMRKEEVFQQQQQSQQPQPQYRESRNQKSQQQETPQQQPRKQQPRKGPSKAPPAATKRPLRKKK